MLVDAPIALLGWYDRHARALPWRAPDFTNKHTYIGIVVLIFVFGLPIALGAARFYRQQQRA